MNLTTYLQHIRTHLIQTHAAILEWFQVGEGLMHFRPTDGGWTVAEILEHIALTSHFLLILIDKAADKALRNVQNRSLADQLASFDYDLTRMDRIGRHKSFPWIRPEHMEPQGEKTLVEITATLKEQLDRCLAHLDRLKDGEGLLYSTTMTVDDLGRLNVYEYIYFLSKHAERHLQQLQENRREYERHQ